MNRNKPKSLVDVANDIADLVRNSKVMLTFREKDQTWYNMYQQKEQQWKDYNEQRQKLQENMIFKDPEFRNLCDEEEKLSQEKTAVKKEMDAIGKKQAEGKNLSKKEKRELENLTGKFNGLENNLNNVEKKRNERYACLEKPYEQAAAKIKIPDGPNPRNWLSLPEFYTTANDANIAYVFGMDNNSRITQLKVKNSDLDVTLQAALVEEIQAPYDDVLGPLTRYVRLTILYDKILSSSTVEGISKGIWPKDESFAEVFWEELQAGWEYSEEIRGIINEDIQNVKKELSIQRCKHKTNDDLPAKNGPISKTARLILHKLKQLDPEEAMLTSDILDWLSDNHNKIIDESTLQRHLREIKPYGLTNKPRIGYFIRKTC